MCTRTPAWWRNLRHGFHGRTHARCAVAGGVPPCLPGVEAEWQGHLLVLPVAPLKREVGSIGPVRKQAPGPGGRFKQCPAGEPRLRKGSIRAGCFFQEKRFV
jgi:hypothetical protein